MNLDVKNSIKQHTLLLLPANLAKAEPVLESMVITKKEKSVDYKIFTLEQRVVQHHYKFLPTTVLNFLYPFCTEALQRNTQQAREKFKQQRAGINHDQFLYNARMRYLGEAFNGFKPFFSLVRWYHKVPVNKGKITIAPCSFSPYKPQLTFEVYKKGVLLKLEVIVLINGSRYVLTEFVRYGFLLLSKNEYFILSYTDFRTLEWLDETNPDKYAIDALAFSQQILVKLEADYPVDRGTHFGSTEIHVPPVNRILLSELSNSFLMLTPQWTYDGFLAEGAFNETFEKVVEGEVFKIRRNKTQEDEFVATIKSLHPNFSKQHNGYYYLPFAEAQKKQWFLKTYHKLLETGIELTGMDMLHHFRYSPHKVQTTANIKKVDGNRAILQMTVSFGAEIVSLASLQKILLAGQKAVLLKDSSLGVLGEDWMQQYGTIIRHGRVEKDTIEVASYMALSEQQDVKEPGVLQPLVKEQWWAKWKQWQQEDTSIYELPTLVNATLRPYQQKGFEWLTLLSEAGAGGCLADDMGLGKTLQAICFLGWHIERNPGAAIIIVAPSSLIYNWQQELKKFAPSITVAVHHGVGRQASVLAQKGQVIITSYGTLRADAVHLTDVFFDIAIIDESHNIKNPSAQITNVLNNLRAATRIALSGTPVVNNTFDLFAQLNFALPGMFGSREFFKREYADAIDRSHDEEKIAALHRLTAPFILRRTKEQVAKDLPDKTESILWCTMKMEQQDLYNSISDQVKSSLFLDIKNNGLGKSKLAVIQAIMKLRQVCNSPMLLPPEEQQQCTQSVKTNVLVQELNNILTDHKALVFSQFSSMLDLLAAELDKQGIAYYQLDGRTPPAKRAEMVAAFQEPNSPCKLFLLSLKAGNTGLTLTAADYVFLFDPWWNTATEQQAIDRTHRIGQTKNVFAYKLICKGTIEEKIIQLQQRKKKLAEELISEDNGFVQSLNEEDIAFLFS